MGRLFGTDGIRGKANTHPMTPEMVVRIGRAVAQYFRKESGETTFLIGRDTRVSGDMIEAALVSGICAMGVNVVRVSVLPTPGVAYMTKQYGAQAGVMISASHNPYDDNGLKLFDQDGYKLPDDVEQAIEEIVLSEGTRHLPHAIDYPGRASDLVDGDSRYVEFLKSVVADARLLAGIKIILDCANGAAWKVAPALFQELGGRVETLFADPDGLNINDHCGSQHPETLAKAVREKKADIGLAFDGDGDRLIAVDDTGLPVTGDQILAICAKVMKQDRALKNNTVVSTVMSNLGLTRALEDMGIRHVTAGVGDRQVLRAMLSQGAILGGEDSGHMLFLNHHTTGDGLLSGLKLLECMLKEGKPLSQLRRIMTVFPQILITVPVKEKPDLSLIPEIQDAIRRVEARMAGKGRVLVRYSGTQSQCRVMVAGPSEGEALRECRYIAEIITARLG